jgi:RNA polymerase sigma factor (sigma-70 family)
MKAKYILEDYQVNLDYLEHNAEAYQRLITRLLDTSISIRESPASNDEDRILRLIGDYENLRDQCLSDIDETRHAFNRAKQIIGLLDPKHGWILTARYLEGMSLRAIAEQHNISKDTVNRRLENALEALERAISVSVEEDHATSPEQTLRRNTQ